MKVTINGFIGCVQYPWDKSITRYDFSMFEPSINDTHRVLVMPHSIEIEVPDTFSPVPGQIAALKAQKSKLSQEFADRVLEISDKINSLLAIENAA